MAREGPGITLFQTEMELPALGGGLLNVFVLVPICLLFAYLPACLLLFACSLVCSFVCLFACLLVLFVCLLVCLFVFVLCVCLVSMNIVLLSFPALVWAQVRLATCQRSVSVGALGSKLRRLGSCSVCVCALDIADIALLP